MVFISFLFLCIKVKFWITINEPLEVTAGYGGSDFAPMINLEGVGEYLAAHHILKAHARAYRLYQKNFKAQFNGLFSM